MLQARPHVTGVAARRVAAAVAMVLTVVAAWPGVASAHAQLESSTPAAGSIVRISPAAVVLRFDEGVEIDFGSVRVFGASGSRVDSGGAYHPRGVGSDVAISLPPRLADGAYVVAWRVISADSHPVHGAFIFSVGTSRGLASAGTLAAALANESGSPVVGGIYWMIRLIALAGLLSLVGTGAMVLAAAPAAGGTKRIRRVLWASWGALFAATVAGIAIQGVYAAALPLGDITRPTLIREVLDTRFGHVELLRLALLFVAVPLIVLVTTRRRAARRWSIAVACTAVAVALLSTPGLAGHATSGSAIVAGFVLDVVHLGSASLWIGGLVVLGCLIVPDAAQPAEIDVEQSALRVSTIVTVAVAVVVLSGTLQAIRQVGSVGALVDTTYGVLLVIKVSIVAVLLALGATSRTLLRRGALRGRAGATGARRTPFVRSVVAELAVATAVLGVTAALVNAPPAREQLNVPYAQSYTTLGAQVNVTLSPAAAGVANTLHIYVLSAASGLPRAVPEVDATLSYPADHLGPLVVPLSLAGVGHYRARGVTFISPGTWVLTVTVRTTPIDEQATPLQVPVR